jgi:hypothetical protein
MQLLLGNSTLRRWILDQLMAWPSTIDTPYEPA